MSDNHETLEPAVWRVDAHGTLHSVRYGDVYHSAAGALAQARHVFLHGNGLPQRWRGRTAFTVCETGFGLGQNFLATWQAWRDDPHRSARLHYLAFEAHPFRTQDLRRLQQHLPAGLRALADALRACWPALLPGLHRLELAQGAVTLTLAFGDIRRLARQVQARVDAFYLDGFAPRVNPDMWSPELFGQLRRLALDGATVASWCAAGQVRRDLRDAGFLVSRAPGFATKREMTVAVLRPGLGQTPGPAQQHQVAVIGGGLAGAGVAQALTVRGHAVEVWDPACALDLDAGRRARGAAALVPALSPDDDTRSRLSRVGLARARARWLGLADPARPDACGALVCAQSDAQALRQQEALARLGFPDDWVRWLDPLRASRQAGLPLPRGGLWFPHALRVSPGALIAALLTQPGVVRRTQRVARLRPLAAGGWQLLAADGRELGRAAQLVLANAAQAADLLAGVWPLSAWPVLAGLKPIAGQVSLYPVRPDEADVPRCVLSGKGYCLPPRHGWAVAGSTYRPGVRDCTPDTRGHQAILTQLAGWLPAGTVPWLGRGTPTAWGGWRAATRDHLPIVGAVPGLAGLWLACAYGSRGLSWSALAGDLIASQLDGEPLPIERELLHRIRVR